MADERTELTRDDLALPYQSFDETISSPLSGGSIVATGRGDARSGSEFNVGKLTDDFFSIDRSEFPLKPLSVFSYDMTGGDTSGIPVMSTPESALSLPAIQPPKEVIESLSPFLDGETLVQKEDDTDLNYRFTPNQPLPEGGPTEGFSSPAPTTSEIGPEAQPPTIITQLVEKGSDEQGVSAPPSQTSSLETPSPIIGERTIDDVPIITPPERIEENEPIIQQVQQDVANMPIVDREQISPRLDQPVTEPLSSITPQISTNEDAIEKTPILPTPILGNEIERDVVPERVQQPIVTESVEPGRLIENQIPIDVRGEPPVVMDREEPVSPILPPMANEVTETIEMEPVMNEERTGEQSAPPVAERIIERISETPMGIPAPPDSFPMETPQITPISGDMESELPVGIEIEKRNENEEPIAPSSVIREIEKNNIIERPPSAIISGNDAEPPPPETQGGPNTPIESNDVMTPPTPVSASREMMEASAPVADANRQPQEIMARETSTPIRENRDVEAPAPAPPIGTNPVEGTLFSITLNFQFFPFYFFI